MFCPSNAACAAPSRADARSTWIGVQVAECERLQQIQRWQSGAFGVLYANRMLLERKFAKETTRGFFAACQGSWRSAAAARSGAALRLL